MSNYKVNIENLIENGSAIEVIKTEIDKANKALYEEKCKTLAYAEKPLLSLYEDNSCVAFRFNENTRILTEVERKIKASAVEKIYRLRMSTATNKNGKPLPNNDITIFGDFKITCALHSFIKKCNNQVTKEVYTFDKKEYTDKTKVLDFSSIMDSKTALDKAVNTIVSLVGITATYKKKYNDGLIHFATSQKINAKGITMSDKSIYDLMDYIIDCCKDKVTVNFSYMQKIAKK